ncbi:UNVERIFIED_CONTAM: hypothetical protein K2H54_039185 [Gekko kuhli]
MNLLPVWSLRNCWLDLDNYIYELEVKYPKAQIILLDYFNAHIGNVLKKLKLWLWDVLFFKCNKGFMLKWLAGDL